ncbi:Leucine-rich repeat [Macleaya cordata]|uniref:Leucine-rich repeat n=1 Tax=Macleaya cordata TaxID=56857 RepID=A0A200PUS2_MACCD|nr:Leucine-rich repeat [Macleaya cordata]
MAKRGGMKAEKRNLVHLCIEAASESTETVEIWRRQRRTLEKMPPELAEALLRRLLRRRLVSPSLLEVFQHCIEEIDLKHENCVDAEWMAYLGAFRCLRSLNIADCRAINNSALWAITGMDTLKELDLSRCVKVTDVGIKHLLSIPNLEKLSVSETGVTGDGVSWLSSLKKLSKLDLGGIPVTDMALRSLQVLTKLEYLDLWGSKISNKVAAVLKKFPNLSFLNLAWTDVTTLPTLPSLTYLNMSNCTINSISGGDCGVKAPLKQLRVPGATFIDVHEVFSYIEASQLSFLDLSNSSLHNFQFLAHMDSLTHLNVSFSKIKDESIELIAHVGANLRNLNLSNTKVSSLGIGSLAGMVPNLEILSLSHTLVDDVALSYISTMPALRVLDLSNTNIKGFTYQIGHEQDEAFSLTALQSLNHLERLDLEGTHVKDEALQPLSGLQQLNTLSLKSDFITDMSLHAFSSLPKLRYLGIRGAVLTNAGLYLFNPPPMLETLDLRGCWLLTEDTISLFHENHPRIKVRHEFAQICSISENKCDRSSPQQGTPRTSQLKPKGKASSAPSVFRKEGFVDERLKYRREELLELRSAPLSLVSPHDCGVVLPKTLIE